MNPAQQQFLQQWQGWLQQVAGQVTAILQEADAGCRGLLASHPSDPMPMQNALQAIHIKVTELNGQVGNAWTQQIERIVAMGDAREVMESGQLANEGLDQWITETWGRFRSQWRVESMKAFWTHVQQLMTQPIACPQCGGGVMPTMRHVADTVTCPHCKGVNQVSPHPDVYLFYTLGPDVWAEAATLEKRFEIERFRDQVKAQLRANRASLSISLTGEEEPVESLLKWEAMEREYWTMYFATKAQLLPATAEEQAQLVEARMKSVLDECKRSNAWRQAKGMENRVEIARTPGVIFGGEEWGPLRPDQTEEFFYQAFMLDDSRDEPSRFHALLQRFGYQSNEQFEHVRITFNRNVNHVDQAFLQMQLVARQRASKDLLAEKSKSSPLLEPIEGVSIEKYGEMCAHAASGMSQQDFTNLLAQHGMDRAKFDRVSNGWTDRMKRDNDMIVSNAYTAAINSTKVSAPGGGPALDPSTVSFEMFCEIMGAQTAWSTQGKDVNAMIKQVFNMTALDWSNVSSYWSPKMMTDMNLAMRMGDLMGRAQAKYMAM